MEVRFGIFAKEINSTKQIDVSGATTQGFTNLECQLKDNVSFLSPVLLVDDRAFNPSWNYAYIYIWNRFYFVHDAVISTGGIWEVQLALDVLASWKSYITGMSAYVARSASHGSDLLEDSTWSHTSNIYTTTQTVDIGLEEDGCYILYTSSNGAAADVLPAGTVYGGPPGVTPYLCTKEQLSHIISYLFSSSFFNDAKGTMDTTTEAVAKMVFNPFQYVLKCMWLPIPAEDIPTLPDSKVRFGWWETNDVALSGALLSAPYITKGFQFTLGTYTDWTDRDSNWTKNDIYVPGIGTMSIPVDYQGQQMFGRYDIDLATGACGVFILDGTGNIIVSGSGQLGADVQLTGLYKDVTGNGVSGLLGNVKRGLFGAISGYTKGLRTMQTSDKSLGGLIDSIGTVASETVQGSQAAIQPTASSVGQNGTRAIIANNYEIKVCTATYNRLSDNHQYLGKVCNQIMSLANLSGYTEIVNPKADIPCTSEETQMINNFLSGGFYLE